MSFWASKVVRGDGAITVQCSATPQRLFVATGERWALPSSCLSPFRTRNTIAVTHLELRWRKLLFKNLLCSLFFFPISRNGEWEFSLAKSTMKYYQVSLFTTIHLLYGIVLLILLLDCHASLFLSLGIVGLLTESHTIHPSSFRRNTYLYSTQLCRA